MKKGTTLIEILVVVGILLLVISIPFSCISKHVLGNKQIIDFNRQRFNYAYVLSDNHVWKKHKIKAWKDWDQSDSIQIVLEDDSYIYTHLTNVKLSSK